MLRNVNINVANNTPGGSAKRLQPLHPKLSNLPNSIKRINFDDDDDGNKSFVEETCLKKPLTFSNKSNAKPGNSNFLGQPLQQKNTNKLEEVKNVEGKKKSAPTGKLLRVPSDPDMRATYTGWDQDCYEDIREYHRRVMESMPPLEDDYPEDPNWVGKDEPFNIFEELEKLKESGQGTI